MKFTATSKQEKTLPRAMHRSREAAKPDPPAPENSGKKPKKAPRQPCCPNASSARAE
jgi:hypothetical protein